MDAPALEMGGASDIWLVFDVPTPQAPLTEYRLVLGDTAPVPLPEPIPWKTGSSPNSGERGADLQEEEGSS